MAKLFTHHDRFHMHAMLGVAALLHFLGRFVYLFATGRDSFAPGLLSTATLAIHVLLHGSSFQFEIPPRRMWSKPMIWKEFRVHNAIFAYRHLLCAALGIWMPNWWVRDLSVGSMVCKVAVVLTTMRLADMATERLGSTEKRTTNAMPYHRDADEAFEQTAKHFYAKSQFMATALAAFGTPMLSFSSVLAIEAASVLMTLVRKGIIETRTYHMTYAASLFIVGPAILTTAYFGDEHIVRAVLTAMVAGALAVRLRMKWRWAKYLAWSVSVTASPFIFVAMSSLMSPKLWIWTGAAWNLVDTAAVFRRASLESSTWRPNGPAAEVTSPASSEPGAKSED